MRWSGSPRASHRDWIDSKRIVFLVTTHPQADRAFARQRNRDRTEVWINPQSSTATIVHEMGHALENLDGPRGRKRAVDHVYSRTQTETPTTNPSMHIL